MCSKDHQQAPNVHPSLGQASICIVNRFILTQDSWRRCEGLCAAQQENLIPVQSDKMIQCSPPDPLALDVPRVFFFSQWWQLMANISGIYVWMRGAAPCSMEGEGGGGRERERLRRCSLAGLLLPPVSNLVNRMLFPPTTASRWS